MSRVLLLLTLVMVGCKGADDDGDQFPAGVDCDDADASIYPGAPELCDGVDNDCDGAVDNDPPDGHQLYADNDGDGFGNPAYLLRACGDVEGFVENAEDCDDAWAAAGPGGVEVCDGHDNDCDGSVDAGVDDAPVWYRDDDGDGYGAEGSVPVQNCNAPSGYVDNDGDCDDTREDLSPASVWYVDADGDGFGNLVYAITACEQPSGTVTNYDDCDDLHAEAFPGGTELCDGLDNDCDGRTDAADDDIADLVTWYDDGDGDGYGRDDSAVRDCFAPSGYTALGNDCDDADTSIHPDATESCDGVDNDCDLRVDNGCPLLIGDAPVLLTGESSADYFGYAADLSGDIDGDGTDDLVVGAYGEDGADGNRGAAGAAYVFYGPLAAGALSATDADLTVRGLAASDFLGYSLGRSADLDGDGLADLLLGAYGDDTVADASGAAYVFYGAQTGDLSATDADFVVYGDGADDVLGNYYMASAGDLNSDGALDYAVGAHAYDIATGSSSSGAIYLFFGPNSGASDAADADLIFYGQSGSDYVGYPASIGRDLNGDGVSDMAIGASGTSSGSGSNAVYLLFGPFGAGTLSGADADYTLSGDSSIRGTGSYIDAGDFDGDGVEDLAIGAKFANYGGTGSGAVFVVNGPFTSDLSLASDADFAVYEPTASMYLGAQYNPVQGGDIDGDGFSDLYVGSYNHSSRVSGGGGAFLFWGPMSGTVTVSDADRSFLGTSTAEYQGNSVSLGDADGDGVLDAMMGGRNYSGGAGRVGVWFGPDL